MTTAYKILFAIDLQNEYYANGKCNDIGILPSAETSLLLKNRQMLYKMVGNKFVVLVKVKDSTAGVDADKPFVSSGTDEKYVFFLQLEKPVFTTITNIDFDLFAGRRFYFSNIFETKAGTALHLSAPVDAYSNTADYKPGDMVNNGTATVFECIKSSNGNDTGNAAFWVNRGENTFSTKKDMYPFITRVTNFKAKTAASVFNIKIFAFNPVSKLYDKAVKIKDNVIEVGSVPTKNVQVNMQQLPNDRYVIKINNEDHESGTDSDGNSIPFYLSDEVVNSNYFGVMEIYNRQATDPDFSLLDVNGKVKDKINGLGKSVWLNYIIQFACKMATWKYIARTGKVISIQDETAAFSFVKTTVDQQDIFQSNIPIRLSEKPVMFDLLLTNAVSSQPPPAPNPDPQVTGIISRTDTDYYCTIYLNY
ncbi:MAG: hypothetical protein ABI685_00055 [Ferruginibacter sp.]